MLVSQFPIFNAYYGKCYNMKLKLISLDFVRSFVMPFKFIQVILDVDLCWRYIALCFLLCATWNYNLNNLFNILEKYQKNKNDLEFKCEKELWPFLVLNSTLKISYIIIG